MKKINQWFNQNKKRYAAFHIVVFILIFIVATICFYYCYVSEVSLVEYETKTGIKTINEDVSTPQYEMIVYITNTGKCYHSSNCGHLFSKRAITLFEAISNGYRACSHCHGTPSYVQINEPQIVKKNVTYTYSIPHYYIVKKYELSRAIGYGFIVAILTYIGFIAPICFMLHVIKLCFEERKEFALWLNNKESKPNADSNKSQHIELRDVMRVSHKKYGVGTVKSKNEKYIIIDFEGVGEKKFQFPDAFDNGYLIKL